MYYRGASYYLFGLIVLVIGGCAGYAGEVQEMRTALNAQNKPAAIDHVNNALELGDADQYPMEVDGETALLLMERATLKQSINQYQPSSIDYRLADNNIEMLDIKRDPLGKIGEWVFSGDAGTYRAPIYEKILLNTFNMLNYLAQGDLESARVEARRIDITQQAVTDEENDDDAILGLADYLSGFAFEMSGRYEQALQQYAESLEGGQHHTLKDVTTAIGRCTSYQSDKLNAAFNTDAATSNAADSAASTTIEASSEANAPDGQTEVPSTPEAAHCELVGRQTGTVLIVSSIGLAPHKRAQRIPIGAAVVIAAAYLSPAQTAQANSAMAKGLLKWINFPELKRTPSAYTLPSITVDGQTAPVAYSENISELVEREFESVKGKLMAAAIVRMLARAVAGEAVGQGVKAGSDSGALGLLAQILVEGAMVAADTPDTRCWNTLPATVAVTRMEVPAGTHNINIAFRGGGKPIKTTITKEVPAGGFVVIPVHTLK